MIQFQENNQTYSKTEGWTDPILQEHSGYHQGYNKYNCSRIAFKSQRYRVRCRSNQKLLHQSQHAKKSPQFINSLLYLADFRISRTKWPRPFLTTSTIESLK